MAKLAKLTSPTVCTERFEIAIIEATLRADAGPFAFLAKLSRAIMLADLRTFAILTNGFYTVMWTEIRAFTGPT
jgi:hypothetical protein